MHCPNCAVTAAAGQQFCRACGFNLEKVWPVVAEQLQITEADETSSGSVVHLLRKQHRIERWLSIALFCFIAPFIAAIILGIVYKIMIVKGDYLSGAIFLAIFLAALTALALVVYRESVRDSLARRKVTPPDELPAQPATKRLAEARFEPARSVTEHTTELFAAKRKPNTREI
ncbi:MAG: hypothetical protein JO360_07690 [Acidobacteria bacterium]|nr:hypothetical protein [Acidobacteriota bacterium]